MAYKWFKTASPESVGISSASIEKLIDTMCMHDRDQETHGFTIIRHNKIVSQGYFAPFSEGPHVIHSCSKAFTATAIGFAVQEGLLSLDDPAVKYFPDLIPENPDPRLYRLTIRHLLTMANGHTKVVFKRPYGEIAPQQLLADFFAADFSYEPGEHFSYENTNTYVLSAMIKRVAGCDLIEYLRPRLFEKLKIDPFYSVDDDGMFVGYGTMRMTMEELARFGRFYMDGCVWEGERLLSEEWARLATSHQIDTTKDEKVSDWNQGYAFQMWRGQHNSFRFCGAFGQICACYPDQDMMFLLNSGHTPVVQDELDTFYEEILTKLQDTLPENPQALTSLKNRIRALRLPQQYSPASPYIPSVTEKTFQITDCGNIISARLDFQENHCHIVLGYKDGRSFVFDAGLTEMAFTDCPDTHIVAFQPADNAVCAASGYWRQLNEFVVDAHMLPTHTMFHLTFLFHDNTASLKTEMVRAYPFGDR